MRYWHGQGKRKCSVKPLSKPNVNTSLLQTFAINVAKNGIGNDRRNYYHNNHDLATRARFAGGAGVGTVQRTVGGGVSKLYDFTSLSNLLVCETEWDYRYRQHLARPTPDVSAHFGQVVHAGVRALFAGEDGPAAASTAWGAFVAPPKKAHLNLAYAQNVVEQYAASYFGENAAPFELVMNERYLEQEERSLCGIVDRVVRSKQDGALYVIDLKSTGLFLNGAWFEQWRHSLQAAIYLDLVEHALAQPVAGFWVDAIHLDRRGHAKREDFMRVGPFPYSEALRAELRTEVDELVSRVQYLDANIPKGYRASKNPKNCFRYNSLCSFFQFCTLDPEDRGDAVQMGLAAGDFVETPWRPSERK